MMKKLLFLFLVINQLYLSAQDIEFYREDLDFTLSEQYFSLEGEYYFCNISNRGVNRLLFYPFPEDSIYGIVDSVSVTDGNSGKKIEIQKVSKKGFYFNAELGPYGMNTVKISYRQELKGKKAEYILLSTKSWNKPFEIINYTLKTPDNMIIKDLSYLPDSKTETNGYVIYKWVKKDFLPDKNFIVFFE